MSYFVSEIKTWDKNSIIQMDNLLKEAGIKRDANLDYSCGVFDNDVLIATGSSYKNTLRCLAVSPNYQGEGLMNMVVSHLIAEQIAKNNNHIFLYTKIKNAKFFTDLGFYPIAEAENDLIFMENKKSGFANFLDNLKAYKKEGKAAAIVMNANPFTMGHKHLVEYASKNNDVVHIFMLSEESSPIPFAVRKRLIEQGVKDFNNVILHKSHQYLISSATFPSYFLPDEDTAILAQAKLDLAIFKEIARTLNITSRYVGEEKFSHITALYNKVMAEKLPLWNIEFCEIPRLELQGQVVSASTLREEIKKGNFETIKFMLPPTSREFFESEEAKPIIEGIKAMKEARHY